MVMILSRFGNYSGQVAASLWGVQFDDEDSKT